jgi:hypothetical protein
MVALTTAAASAARVQTPERLPNNWLQRNPSTIPV